MTTLPEVSLDSLLAFVKRNRGFDFTGYKRSSLERRLHKRMEEVGCATYADYLDHLEVHQDEFAQLFNTILINVTAFFRDGPAWDHLRAEVVPSLIAARPADAPLRVWCAGAASGEEAYTIAMVLADALGERAFRDRVRIYATDVDEEALQTARLASYDAKAVEGVPREALERYFERHDTRHVFRQDLRRAVIFGRNDLVQDAPISRIDLLLCRNTLMYFNAETQSRILRRFHFGLDEGGVLVLGKSERLITHGDLFQPLDLKRRVFRKVVGATMRERLHFVTHPGETPAVLAHPSLRDSAMDAGAIAQVVVDAESRLVAINQAARELFSLSRADIGRPLQDLELSYRPLELRAPLDRMRTDQRAVTLEGVRLAAPGRDGDGADGRILDVRIAPLLVDGVLQGASITYNDVTRSRRLQDELTDSKRELEQAFEALQSTVEELDTTNEELQSTNEELETTNEELQSTNEELETMNEELQSTNEELETINDELRTRTVELDEANAFLEMILSSTGAAVAVLDARQEVQIWNANAEDLWGLRADEAVGQHFLGLDIGLPVDELRPVIRSALQGVDGHGAMDLQATDRRGRSIACAVTTLPLIVGGDDAVKGVILLVELKGRGA
ncbi:MAG TPA: CheR family methyltransferase [Baekduia sp.]|nr:CheR family methyltransferase [Baekduia sp.]